MALFGSGKSNTRTVEDLQRAGFDALGNSGLLEGFEGWSGGLAPVNDNMRGAMDAMAGGVPNRDFSKGILDAGRGYTPTTISGEDIQGLMSPYLDRVGASTMREIGRSYDDASAMAGARAAAGGAFPGSSSGLALQRAQMARGEAETKQDAINGILQQGWNQASNLAQTNAGILNQAGQFNSNLGLQANIAGAGAYGDFYNRGMQGIDNRLRAGLLERGFEQEQMDLPWTNYQRYMNALPGEVVEDTSPGFFQNLLGLGLTVGGMATPGGGSLLGSWLT